MKKTKRGCKTTESVIVAFAVACMVVLQTSATAQIIPGRTTGSERPGDMVQGVVQPGANQADRVSVLVHLAAGANRGLVRGFAANQGGFVKYEYGILPNVMNLRGIPRGALNALRAMPGVVTVEDDRIAHAHLTQSIPLIRALQTDITGAGLSADGSGVRVCIVDTGIDTDHIMYSSRIDTAAGRDFVNNDNNPEDDNGHGSNVAGIAVGGTGISLTVCGVSEVLQGVAPNATLIGIKVLDQNGSGTFSDVIAGIDYGADQTAGGGRCDVMNLSLGGGAFAGNCDTDTAAIAANNAVAAGVVFVSSAGNEGNANALGTPACASGAIAVGAVYDSDFPNCEDPTTSFTWCLSSTCAPQDRCTDSSPLQDSLACFSNHSDTLDVAAPGCTATSADIAAGGSTVSGICGTSQASPHVAGLAALILSVDPSLTPAEVRQIIRDGAIDLGPAGFDTGYGWGRIDAINSLQLVGPGCSVAADCDDLNACTVDACNAGVCSNTPVDCDDADACTTDGCSGGVCSNVPINCDDADACTTDSCAAGTCFNDPIACPVGEVCVGGTCQPSLCNNDGTCDVGEDCNNCPADCISGTSSGAACGNGVCEAGDGENCVSCAADCNGRQSGRPRNRFCCGDGGGQNPLPCSDAACTGGGNTCTDVPTGGGASFCCGDTLCEGNEDSTNCAVDCGAPAFCGDGFCDPGEDSCTCSVDCGAPPATETNCTDGIDNDCDGLTDANDPDCPSCGGKGDSCGSGADCCSGNCKRNGTCR